jgi:dTDP-4-amino-4,6-dideoxygalactose transaminase
MVPLFSAAAANTDPEIELALLRVLRSHWYVLGNEVAGFEREFADYIGVAECVSLANGTDALELALRAVGVEPGDAVACAANAGFYASAAIHAVGARPLYVDIDAATLNMAPAAFLEAVQLRPKAVIVTHLYGQMADMETLAPAARRANVTLIEDCAQAHGAMLHGRRAGSMGDMGCFSFYPTKNLGGIGDGGAIVTQDPSLAGKMRALRQYGWSAKYHVATPGGRNSRLDEIQAAVLRAKLPRLDAANARRRDIAARYNAAFATLPMQLPPATQDDYVGHLYVVRVDSRDALREHLRSHEIATDVHYPVPDHLQTAYPGAQAAGSLPHTERACASVVTLPCFPGLADADIERVIAAVHSFFVR